ncbi:MAG: DinB family protein [Acidobacteria bacterium]|nr:DinB family protein [Acidobacteriota bacterium]
MNVKDLAALYDYSYWANRKLFQLISQLSAKQFAQPVAGSYGSIRNTLLHALSAEWGWLDRCGGPQRGPRLNPDDYPTISDLEEAWNKVEVFMRAFLCELKDEELAREIEFTIGGLENCSMSMGYLLHHAVIHGIHHRAQVALLLRMLGYEPGNFDLLIYYTETLNFALSTPQTQIPSTI